MLINSQDQLKTFLDDFTRSAANDRMRLAQKCGVDQCYYEGVQWLNALGPTRWTNTTLGRVYTNWNPDTKALRVTMNEVTEKIVHAVAASHPTSLGATIEPPARDAGVEATTYTQVHEDALSVATKKSGLLLAAQDANHNRAICGTYGIALGIVKSKGPGGLPATQIVARTVHPTRYILDPAMTSRNLRDHEKVVYEDVWTAFAIRNAFPQVKFNDEDLATVGQLTTYEQQMSLLSDGRLFSRYRQNSLTKGARVFEIHVKSPTGMWDEYHIGIEIPSKEIIWVNANNPVTPYGGDGLPHVLLHAHRRACESIWSISDVGMCKDPQDRLNLLQSLIFRHLQRFTAPQWVIDKRFFGTVANKEDYAQQFKSQAGGLIVGHPSADKSISPPTLINPPPPQPMYTDLSDRASADMRRNSFRTDYSVGQGAKTHVPYETTRALLAEGDRVLGIRVTEDADAYGQILNVLLGTQINLVQQMDAGILASLDQEGFDESDLAVLMASDPRYPACKITVAEGNIRYRSANERRSDLAQTLSAQAISPSAFRQGMAELDAPVTPQDNHMRVEIEKAVTECLKGKPWIPLPLGPEYGDWAVSALRRALFDRASKRDPMTRQRIADAIALQTQTNVQDAIASNPEAQMQMQQAQAQAQAAEQEQAEPEEPPPATVGEAFDRLLGGGQAAA